MSRPRPAVVGASASAAIRDRVTASPTRVDVLAAFPSAVYLSHPAGIVAVVAADGIAHPNAIGLAADTSERPFAAARVGASGRLGDHRLEIPGLHAEVRRWWRPRPALPTVAADDLARCCEDLDLLLATAAPPLPIALAAPVARLRTALHGEDIAAALAQVDGLLGLGPGLTPSGDDLLCGLLSAIALLGPAVGAPAERRVAAARVVGAAVVARAPAATTSISAALLAHAVHGEVSDVAADVVHALAGRQPLAPAVRALLAVGATSGRDLTAGLLAGARVVSSGVLSRSAASSEETR
ncbi:MAG: DUF2877 domain-containing protein [Actinobacteria bacterium]|nr:DUF2877 domain-containing protein [Actinomycetota bacterium]